MKYYTYPTYKHFHARVDYLYCTTSMSAAEVAKFIGVPYSVIIATLVTAK